MVHILDLHRVFPPISPTGATLLLGAISLNGIPLGMLMRDPSYLQVDSPTPDTHQRAKETERAPLVATDDKHTWYSHVVDKLGLRLLKNWMFVMYMLSTAMSFLPQDSQHWFIPDRAIEIGFSSYHAAMTLTLVNCANIFSRLVFGIMSSDKFFNHVIMLIIYDFTSGLNSMLVQLWSTYWTYIGFSILFGLFRGLYVIYELLLMVDIVGKDQVDLGYGLIFTAAGFVFLITIPIFGHFNEVTHSYVTTFMLYGGLEILGGVFLLTVPIYLTWKSWTSLKDI